MPVSKLGTIRGFIEFLLARNIPAKGVDTFVCATDVAKYADRALLLLRMESLEQVVHMCEGANHILCLPNGNKNYCGALFNDISKFPITRFYYLELHDIFAAGRVFGELKARFTVEIPPPEVFGKLVHENGWEQRLKQHVERRNERIKDYEKIRAGRCSNTTTDEILILNSTGCLVCSEQSDYIASFTIAASKDKASLFAVRLCSEHMDEARVNAPLVNYIAKVFKIPFLVDTLKRTASDTLADAKDIVKFRLGMTMFEATEKLVKARTSNGTVLIYRYANELNYGYMINAANGEELARIDSANHHKVEVGPDHLHPDLRNKLPPVSSYTTGDLYLDWPLISRLITSWEESRCCSG